MKKTLATLALAGASLAMFAGASPAGAAHCTAPAGEEAAPGYSYFGTDHVQGAAHDSEGIDPATGDGRHAGTPGASNCRSTDATDTTGGPSPQSRAPGQNR